MDFLSLLNKYPFSTLIPLTICLVIAGFAYVIAVKKQRADFLRLFVVFNLLALLIIGILVIPFFASCIWAGLFGAISLIFFTIQVLLPCFVLLHLLPLKLKTKKLWQKTSSGRKFWLVFYAIFVLLISFDAYFLEPNMIDVTNHDLPTEKDVPDLNIVHITDIQTDYLGMREKKTVEIVRDLKPDLILVTGDYTNGTIGDNPDGKESVQYVLQNLDAKYGVFAISGNANPPSDHGELFAGSQVRYLDNESVRIEVDGQEIYLIGVDWWQPNYRKAFEGVPDSAYKILLFHTPDAILSSYAKKADLILVGHTHGGQINLPYVGALSSASKVGRHFARGWFEVDEDTVLYVNRGLGMEGFLAPRIRFLCRPEVALFKLETSGRGRE